MDEYTTAETAELLANVRPDRSVKGARALAALLDDHRCPTVLDLGRLQAAS